MEGSVLYIRQIAVPAFYTLRHGKPDVLRWGPLRPADKNPAKKNSLYTIRGRIHQQLTIS